MGRKIVLSKGGKLLKNLSGIVFLTLSHEFGTILKGLRVLCFLKQREKVLNGQHTLQSG